MLNLTSQQIKVFDVIKNHLTINGYPPTRAEIAKTLNFNIISVTGF